MTTANDRQAWLEKRRQGIGATDAAALTGLSSWSTPLGVYCSKLGLWEPEENEQMHWGKILEPVIAANLGEPLTQGELVQSELFPWMLCTPDYIDRDGNPVEIKTSRGSSGWGPDGSDEAPLLYLAQVVWQMMVMGREQGRIVALLSGNDLRTYSVKPTPEVCDTLRGVCASFWYSHVKPRIPPQPDWQHRDTPSLIQALYPLDEQRECDLDEEASELAGEYRIVSEQARELTKRKGELRNQLLFRMGESHVGRSLEGLTVTRTEITLVRKAQPERITTQTRLTVK